MTITNTDELRARLFLLRVAEPPAPAVYDYVAVHGPVEATAQHPWSYRTTRRPGRNHPAPGEDRARPAGDRRRPGPAVDTRRRRLAAGAPSAASAPLALWVRGDASLTELTGTRWASGYGNTVAADFGYDLARAGVTVVGGGSAGIDESAHRATLAGDRRTVVVLPCGVDQTYPRELARLYDDVVERGGLLISEHPIGVLAVQARLVARCRLLAALSSATVIVEAGQCSFALATAHAANALGRRVYGVPGSVYSTSSKGVNELLRTGAATAVTSTEHINYQERLR
jgi:DNA processing protein